MDAETRCTRWSFLGPVPYDRANDLQERTRERLKEGRGEEHLLLLEHDPPVYTLGRNASTGEIRSDEAWRRSRGIEVVECDRGGQATYHGPGQLVGWPIIDLSPDRKDVRRYVRDLQEVLVRTLRDFGVEAVGRPMPEIGVWVGDEKIASVGIHLSRWITTHGFALNVEPDLEHFGGIVPCGLPEVRTSERSALFEECALALARSIESARGLEPGEEHSVDVTAGSLEDLMVEWLEEQVFLCDTRGFLMVDCYVEIRDEADGRLRLLGVLRGDRYSAERHLLKVQVKAVTYHGLKVERRDDEWFARIILDI